MHDRTECPHCHESITELWEYNWGYSDDTEQKEDDCEHCGKPITVTRWVNVTY